jgi:hypothetical protein
MELAAKYSIVNSLRKDMIEMVLDCLRGSRKDSVRTLTPVTSGDRSPVIIQQPENPNEFLIFYPKNSAKYTHELDGTIKRCEIITGEIHEEICGKSYTPESGEFVIPSDQKYRPFTLDSICIARVILEKPGG